MAKKTKRTAKKPVTSSSASSKRADLPIRPLGDKVLIRPAQKESEQRTEGGIILPGGGHEEKQERGIVVAVGPGRWDEEGKRRIPPDVTVGDKVIYVRGYEYQELKVDGVEHILIGANSVLAVTR